MDTICCGAQHCPLQLLDELSALILSWLQWMMGSSLLISPVLQEGSDTVMAYFPDGEWFSLYDYSHVAGPPGWKPLMVRSPLFTCYQIGEAQGHSGFPVL